ncbi:MAG: 50S ribosomal protein L24 [Candidatus Vogelbacteria bacterium]|nr:50S ribosomal protein L24 [Candidatus Vogelbacteria bacterium]
MKVKKGDSIIIVAGKDSGKRGKVLRAIPSRDAVIIEDANLRKRRQRPRRAGQKGQVLTIPTPMRTANVALWCEKCKKGVRVGHRIIDGKKARVCKKCGTKL